MPVLQKTQTIVRYQQPNGSIHYGVVEDGDIFQLSGGFTEMAKEELTYDGVKVRFDDVTLLEPVVPSKIVNFGWTYVGHATETGGTANLREPFLFLKPVSSLIPDQGEILLPSGHLTSQVEMEGEVALVIGKRGKNIKEEDALDYVFGCTIFNDVTARDLTKTDPQFTRGKGFDTFGPLGPCIVKGLDPRNLRIVTTLNGRVVQDGNTNEMSLSIPFLISWISQVMTLEPGDILATGSPSGSCPMKHGDIVSVEVEQIGTLCNYVKQETEL
ncbi:fumarylacetoacetate hydrolase family protein [Domibacillus enclensis]|uniref:2-keto-4-pentenoate hydratase/2-oxohepta-3-ene-1,7-dioic acid hydratase (Catechol pathway) n=1 Tax=Domibacillus enclensis TaxID=1017273 RepID=A0A1N7D1Q6_9BACI|nr:fumarylacetoacetate hydrolase family protein [Domibacillus enclensis]OXS72926.1 fumarylacetoacetate hydrolase [Domibacillus enclensis]SIR69761.1 2-keto-4-pentenoate hydratase/2-oxohepta-3-ene-1,7-dioic acid hydratase (catechol pathway) [Domibacillus enclensis]